MELAQCKPQHSVTGGIQLFVNAAQAHFPSVIMLLYTALVPSTVRWWQVVGAGNVFPGLSKKSPVQSTQGS